MKVLHYIKEKTDKREFYIKADMTRFGGRMKYTRFFKFKSIDDIETYSIIKEDSKLTNLDAALTTMKYTTFQCNYSFILKKNSYIEISKTDYKKGIIK